MIAARRGDVAASQATAKRSLEIAVGGPADPASPQPAVVAGGENALWALGSLALASSSPSEAAQYLLPLGRALVAARLRDPGELRCLPDAVEAAVEAGMVDAAESLVTPLEEGARSAGRPTATGAAAHGRGLVLAARGELGEAVVCLERAAADQERGRLPFERARTLHALGVMQRRVKRRREARDSLSAAIDSFERIGARLWAERTRRELGRIGGRRPSGGELTETERRIAELVGEGRSNKEIAAALFVTPKTVETKLSRLYAKLGIHSRAELARRLSENKP